MFIERAFSSDLFHVCQPSLWFSSLSGTIDIIEKIPVDSVAWLLDVDLNSLSFVNLDSKSVSISRFSPHLLLRFQLPSNSRARHQHRSISV